MESSPFVKQEYFKLVKKLNHSNKLKNQKTDLFFYIDLTNPSHLKLYAAISDSQKILLCKKSDGTVWTETGFSEYPNLEDFIAQLLQIDDKHKNLTEYFKSHIFKLTN
ncbi:MAG: hypothetical protein AABY53_10585 [Bdellovibrionota bacterium]